MVFITPLSIASEHPPDVVVDRLILRGLRLDIYPRQSGDF
jgi:hypothetical protein